VVPIVLVLTGVAVGLGSVKAVNVLRSEAKCDATKQAEKDATSLAKVYSPPLAKFEVTGLCEDQEPQFGIYARMAGTPEEVRDQLETQWNCSPYEGGPFYEDFDRHAKYRFTCDLTDLGKMNVAVDPHGLIYPNPGPGTAVGFIRPAG
jgi:hypothetical protein